MTKDNKVFVALYETQEEKVIPAFIIDKITSNRKVDIRIAIANELLKVKVNVTSDNIEDVNYILESDRYVKAYNDNSDTDFTYIFKQVGADGIKEHTIMVKQVDTSKPWKIENVLGKECIAYNDTFRMVDTELNYADWK